MSRESQVTSGLGVITYLPPAVGFVHAVITVFINVPHVLDPIPGPDEERKVNGFLLQVSDLQARLDACIFDANDRIRLCHSRVDCCRGERETRNASPAGSENVVGFLSFESD